MNVVEAKSIHAWYWGHEHCCAISDQHAQWGLYGRCIGHSGFPYGRRREVRAAPTVGAAQFRGVSDVSWHRLDAKNGTPASIVLDGPNSFVVGKEAKFGPNGYGVLEFDRDRLSEAIYDPAGTLLYRRDLT